MKTIYFLLGCSITFNVNAQQWSAAQLAKANTANEVKELTFEEKQTIMYLNLARMYPKDYKRIRFNKNALFGIIIDLGIVSKAKFTTSFI